MQASELAPLVAVGLGWAASGLCAVRSWQAWRGARLIAANPPAAIARLRPGLMEVKGVLHGEGTLVAPLSRRACLYHRLLVEQRRKNRWEVVLDQKDAVGVWLDDGSGRVKVDPREAEVVISAPKRVSTGIFEVPSSEWTDLLERLGTSPPVAAPFLRYREEVLENGDTLFAVGTASQGEDGWVIAGTGQGGNDDVHVLSDWEEAEVIRIQQRTGQRWAAITLLAGAMVTWGTWTVLTFQPGS